MTLETRTVEIGDHRGPHAIKALSVAGLETCIHVPKYDLLFDIGRCPEWAVPVRNVLVSHGHTDHAGGLHFHTSHRTLQGMKPPQYFVPPEIGDLTVNALHVQNVLGGGVHDEAVVVCLAPGDTLDLNQSTFVQSFKTDHRVPAQGYIVLSRKNKVKAEYVGLKGSEYAKLRAQGVVFQEEVATPEVVYSGDTRIEGLLSDPIIGQARLLVTECSFIDGVIDLAREWGHIHLDEIVHALREGKLQNEQILLTHFSNRYKRDDILRALDEKVPAEYRDRITPIVNNS